MNGRKLTLLLAILLLGGALEGAFAVRPFLSIGPPGCRVRNAFDGPSFSLVEERRLELPSGGTLRVTNTFGRVHVKGGSTEGVSVRFEKRAFAPDEARAKALAERVQLRAEAKGDRLEFSSNRAELEHDLFGETGIETHFDIDVPTHTRVEIVNEHGSVEVRDVASAELENAHDALVLERVLGDAQIKMRHGETRVVGVEGALQLEARHGDVQVREAHGLKLDLEHGNLELERAGASQLRLRFAKATVRKLAGGLQLDGEHAELDAEGVAGNAQIETSFREVRLGEVMGDVQVKTQHGQVEIRETQGKLELVASFGAVTLAGVGGFADVSIEHGGLEAQGLRDGGRLRVSGDDLKLTDFKGAFQLELNHSHGTLEPGAPLIADLRVSSKHGDVTLELPTGSRCDVQARVKFGELRVEELPSLAAPQSDEHEQQVTGRVGGGGAQVTLETEHGDLRLVGTETRPNAE